MLSARSKLRLTPKQAVTFTLTRQHLAKPAERPLDVVRHLVAIQAQYAASVPIVLWARCVSLAQDWLKNALSETKALVKTWCLRGTVHVLASADLAIMAQAVGRQQLGEHEYFMKTRRGIDAQAIRRFNKSILRALARRPLSRSELRKAVPELAGIPGSASWGADVKALALLGELVFADADGIESRFARRDVWLPELAWALPSEEEAQRELLLRYLSAYGPATRQDFAHWSGLKMKVAQAIFEACARDLIPVEVAGWRGDCYVRREDEPLLKTCEEPAAVKLLPKFDPLLMAYTEKTRFIAEEHLARVYRPAGQVEAVVLLRGRVIATWRAKLESARLRLTCAPFRRLRRGEQSAITAAAEQLAEFLGARELSLVVQ